MAKQKGIVPLKGTIGNISFYKSKDGFIAREESGIDKKRIANDPTFQRTRENGEKFGRAGVDGKLLRISVRQLLQNIPDSRKCLMKNEIISNSQDAAYMQCATDIPKTDIAIKNS